MSDRLNNTLADKIAKLTVDTYDNQLKKTGKPADGEWTILASVVQYDNFIEDLTVVALGTGSKCIGASTMNPDGFVVNDSHAEVMARRAFLLYLYENMKRTAGGETTIFRLENNKFKLDENIEFYFYSSMLPCGDACIMSKNVDEELVGSIIPYENNKRPLEDSDEGDVKKQKLSSGDIHRTGAKCLAHNEQDKHEPGADYHLLGQIRTKPGRGDPTLSVSCSDKLARWLRVGIQGALLDMLLDEPIHLKMIVIGADVPYSEESLERALIHRNSSKYTYLKHKPVFFQSNIEFTDAKYDDSIRMCPSSIVWTKYQLSCFSEVCNKGRRQGVVKKKEHYENISLAISKYHMYKRFLLLLQLLDKEVLKNTIGEEAVPLNVPYNVMKQRSKRYQDTWNTVKKDFFGTWTIKPDIWNFYVDLEKKTKLKRALE